MTSFVVSGYASLDHAVQIDRQPRPDRTAVVTSRLSPTWPAQGGCAPFVARTLARAGRETHLLSWFGDDPGGRAFVTDLASEGVRTDAVVVHSGARTATSWLLYDPDGGTTCVYDPGDVPMDALADQQLAAVRGCDWLVVTVGPRPINSALLDALDDDARLVYAVKADRDAFPPDLVHRYVDQAALLSFSRGERTFLEEVVGSEALAGVGRRAVLIETRGTDGVVVTVAGADHHLPVEPVEARDTTGAGDTLLASSLSRLATAGSWPPAADEVVAAVQQGIQSARGFLQARARTQE